MRRVRPAGAGAAGVEIAEAPKHYFTVSDGRVNKAIRIATREYGNFKRNSRDVRALSNAIGHFKTAVSNSQGLDNAYCRRRYATTIIRNSEIDLEERYQDAQANLALSIATYRQYLKPASTEESGAAAAEKAEAESPAAAAAAASEKEDAPQIPISGNDSETIIVELQRALALQCHVAMTLKDGVLLKQSANALLESTEEMPNPGYELEALNYLFTVHFSRNEYGEAESVLNKILALKEGKPSDFRHLVKIKLIQLVQSADLTADQKSLKFNLEIQSNFWKAFDPHKTEYQAKCIVARRSRVNFTREKSLLQKDFLLLLMMKIIQRIQQIPGGRADESVCQYMVRQVASVYGRQGAAAASFTGNEKAVHRALYLKIVEIRESGGIPFSYRLFSEVAPASVPVSEAEFEEHLGDFESVLG